MLLDVNYFRNCNKQESFNIYHGCDALDAAQQHKISNIIYNTSRIKVWQIDGGYLFIVYKLFATYFFILGFDEFMWAVAPAAADIIGKSSRILMKTKERKVFRCTIQSKYLWKGLCRLKCI